MEMKARNILIAVLLVVFGFTSTVKEIHYLFIHHVDEHHDECHNHIHSDENHPVCTFCKIDTFLVIEPQEQPNFSFLTVHFKELIFFNSRKNYSPTILGYALRGPPFLNL